MIVFYLICFEKNFYGNDVGGMSFDCCWRVVLVVCGVCFNCLIFLYEKIF